MKIFYVLYFIIFSKSIKGDTLCVVTAYEIKDSASDNNRRIKKFVRFTEAVSFSFGTTNVTVI